MTPSHDLELKAIELAAIAAILRGRKQLARTLADVMPDEMKGALEMLANHLDDQIDRIDDEVERVVSEFQYSAAALRTLAGIEETLRTLTTSATAPGARVKS